MGTPPGKNLVIFGATGRTGAPTLKLALEEGWAVTVLVRDASRLPPGRPPGRVFVGDARDPQIVGRALRGQDAVIIVLGTRDDLGPTTMLSESTKTIVEAMKLHGVRKVVVCLSSFLLWDPEKIPERLLPVTQEHARMEKILRDSGLDCVYVLPPHIEGSLGGGRVVVTEGALGPTRRVGAEDLARFLLSCARSQRHIGQRLHLCGYYPDPEGSPRSPP
ncbi:flavin reductase (NADPH) isoform X2 [Phaenicophaeus curvirostris]|uniref:flavin reductase (NADPH) isoform X2 n=1 Tax=Phaenicophaeus curvirostris TaxID=33595 RepID=UPI0037F09E0C